MTAENKTPQTEQSLPAVSVVLDRLVRPDPRSFERFPPDLTCPICGTNDDGKTVLVQIAGTEKGGIAEAKPMHLACAVAHQWDDGMQLGITWPNAAGERLPPANKEKV